MNLEDAKFSFETKRTTIILTQLYLLVRFYNINLLQACLP